MLWLFVGFVVAVIAINILLWKSGFLYQAEKPIPLIDTPVMDSKERKAILKRLKRWKEEGRLSREEFERFSQLCQLEWDQKEN